MFFNEGVKLSYEEMLSSFDYYNETYYGKNPELLKCEELLKEMKMELNKGSNLNKSESKKKFEDILSNLFGFEKMYLCVIAEEKYMDGFTIPYFNQDNYGKDDKFFDIVKTNEGIKYKNPKGKFLYVYTSSYTIRNFSIDNIMSIILHEVGHNFFLVREQITNAKLHYGVDISLTLIEILNNYNWSPSLYNQVINLMYQVGVNMDDMQLSAYEQYKKTLTDKANKKAEKEYKSNHSVGGKILQLVKSLIVGTLNLPFTIINVVLLPIYLFLGKANKEVLKKDSKKYQSYNAEKFSDNFASSYGYSVGISDTFIKSEKFTTVGEFESKIPIIRIQNYFNRTLTMFVSYYADPHPDDYTRVLDSLNKLKYELNNNKDQLNPKQIAEIEEQIIKIERILKKAPVYKKIINGIFKNSYNDRDKTGVQTYSQEEIWDFDKTIFKDNLNN